MRQESQIEVLIGAQAEVWLRLPRGETGVGLSESVQKSFCFAQFILKKKEPSAGFRRQATTTETDSGWNVKARPPGKTLKSSDSAPAVCVCCTLNTWTGPTYCQATA